MIVTALITCHSRDLALICLRSLARHAPKIQRMTISTHWSCRVLPPSLASYGQLDLPNPPGGAANHAAAIHHARTTDQLKSDIILCLDDDVIILSDEFLATLESAFADPTVGAWGARGIRDALHPSCLAMRRHLFEKVTTFSSALPEHDTTGLAQVELYKWGYILRSVPRVIANDGWEDFTLRPPLRNIGAYPILWSHLGGGVIHAPIHPMRGAVRHVRAAFGHEPSRDLILKGTMRKRWITIYG